MRLQKNERNDIVYVLTVFFLMIINYLFIVNYYSLRKHIFIYFVLCDFIFKVFIERGLIFFICHWYNISEKLKEIYDVKA